MSRIRGADRIAPTVDVPHPATPIRVVMVTSDGCHFCRHADQILAALQQRFPLEIERIDLASPRGTAIARRWRVPFPPVILIEGGYHGHGRMSERALTRALSRVVEERG